jgi:hypothetical protein
VVACDHGSSGAGWDLCDGCRTGSASSCVDGAELITPSMEQQLPRLSGETGRSFT